MTKNPKLPGEPVPSFFVLSMEESYADGAGRFNHLVVVGIHGDVKNALADAYSRTHPGSSHCFVLPGIKADPRGLPQDEDEEDEEEASFRRRLRKR